jgi:hypothetical protein
MRGIARDVQHRTEIYGTGTDGNVSSRHVLTFRIERPGSPPVPVQMKGMRIEGVLADGDEVSVEAEHRPGKVMKTKRVENLTTGVPVVAGVPLYVKIVAVPVVGFVIAMFAYVAHSFATAP